MSKNQNCFEYKGYHTRIEFDYETATLFGKIEGINDLILFESEDASEIEKEFHSAVDDYLDFCRENGKNPEKEYRGLFNVRVSPETHRKLSVIAYKTNDTLNSVVEKALDNFVNSTTEILEEQDYYFDTHAFYSSLYEPSTAKCTLHLINHKEEVC